MTTNLAGKLACASMAFFLAAQTASAEPKIVPNIGDLGNGLYDTIIADGKDSISCLLMIGNYSWGNSGRGYSGIACDFSDHAKIPEPKFAKLTVNSKLDDFNIGDKNNGIYRFSRQWRGKTADCIAVVGNYNWGNAGRGYAGLDCKFSN